MKRLSLVFCLVILAYSVRPAFGDTIILTSGRSTSGTILQTNSDSVLLLTDDGAVTYAKSLIMEMKLDRAEAPDPSSTNRLPGYKAILALLGKESWASNLKQIPATVIDKGILKNVPYISFRCGAGYEVNIYGDLEHPAGVEIGVYGSLLENEAAKKNCVDLVRSFLQHKADRNLVESLYLEKDIRTREGFTFEITPSWAEDAYNGWWVSVYSEDKLNLARASDEEMKRISVSKAEMARDANATKDLSAWSSDELKMARQTRPATITFTDSSGATITNAEVVRVTEGVSLVWRSGASGGVLRLADLPEDLRASFGYDPIKAAAADEAEKARQQADAQARATQAAAQPGQNAVAPYPAANPGYYGSPSYSRSHSSGGSVYVRGYERSNGTYVHSYTRRR